MIQHLKPYTACKDSGIPLLEDVPAHWNVLLNQRIFREVIRPHGGREEVQLSLSQRDGLIATSLLQERSLQTSTFDNWKVVVPGDLVLNRFKAHLGVFFAATSRGMVSFHYGVFAPRRPVEAKYFELLYHTEPYRRIYAGRSNGMTVGLQNLSNQSFYNVRSIVPPLEEQVAIVRYLDHVDRRVRRYVRAKQKTVALLNEHKKSVIHCAVTHGLNSDVRLKPSNVEWLGDVPEHWGVAPLKRHWTVMDCKHLTVPFVEDGIPLASVREVQSFVLSLDNAKRTTLDWFEKLIEGQREPKRGDLIYCRNVSVGACSLVDTDERLAMGQDVCLIRTSKQNQRYLNYFLHSHVMRSQLALMSVGSTFERINVADIKHLVITVPPRGEQNAIATYLDGATAKIVQSVAEANRQVALVREYRTRLVADVVTGKLDVRDAAAHLPNEIDEELALDDSESLVDNEESGEGPSEISLEEVGDEP